MMRSLTRSLIVIVGSTILIAVLGWLTRIVEIPLRLTSRIDSDAGRTVVLRTDFSDEAAWRSLEAAIQAAGGEFRSFVRFVSDPAQATMTSDQIVDFARREERTFIFVVDRLTLTNPDRPLLVIDAVERPGRSFRVVLESMWSVENNLGISNMDFEEFANAVGSDGVFRGFVHR